MTMVNSGLKGLTLLPMKIYVIVHLQVCLAHTIHNLKCLKIIADRLVEI